MMIAEKSRIGSSKYGLEYFCHHRFVQGVPHHAGASCSLGKESAGADWFRGHKPTGWLSAKKIQLPENPARGKRVFSDRPFLAQPARAVAAGGAA
ncbi:hypothetical protein [Brevibacillus choshinensis]|uniref:hypothetical protein n=1 Tax=Brevibacillus choshinensis TaxID=54911 RepID=UPI0009F938D8|nr:hypothetical protein [Brevibacillus choshinensis]